VTTTQIEKQEERKKNKKTIKKREKSAQETKSKKTKFFSHLVALCLDLTAFQKAPGAALWTIEASRFRLSIGHLTYFQFI
jgi:hypothetical protein